MKLKITKAILLLFILLTGATAAQDETSLSRAAISLDFGNLKPSSLDNNPSNPFETVQGACPYYGLSFVTPYVGGFAIRLNGLQWQQKNVLQAVSKESVTLRIFSADIKNSIIADMPVTPYVSIGLAAIWSREVPLGAKDEKIPLDRTGYGANLGAGIDFKILTNWAIAAEYQYLYANFPKKVGLTANYSGPKLSFRVLYLF